MTAPSPPGHETTSHSLPLLLNQLARRHATGFVKAASRNAHREIVMIDGEVRAARSTLEEEMLGMWLVMKGAIRETERARGLLEQGRQNAPPLGHVLVTRQLIEQDVLEKHLQDLALAIIERAVQDADARYEFLEDPDADHPDTLGDLTTTQVILNAARAQDDIDSMKMALGDSGQAVRAQGNLTALLEGLSLTPTEMFVVSRLDGAPDLGALYRMSTLPEEQAIQTVFGLVMAGLITLAPADDAQPTVSAQAPAERPKTVNLEELTARQIEERHHVHDLAERANRMDHYRVLGIERDAAPVQILDSWNAMRERYRSERTREYHLRDAEALLETIRDRALAAYQVLGNAKSRKRYDTILADIDKDRNRIKVTKRDTDAGARSAIVVANIKRADELIKEGEIHLAVQLLEQACAIEPRPLELVKLARLMARNPLWENRVLKCLRQAVEVDPACVQAWLDLAEFWRRQDNSERQRKALEKIFAIDPENARAKLMYRKLAGGGPLARLRRLARLARR